MVGSVFGVGVLLVTRESFTIFVVFTRIALQ